MTTSPLEDLGRKIRDARALQRYDVKAAAAAAGIARDTWVKIEKGESVQDTKRAAALQLLGLDWNGEPVGGQREDRGYVAAPGQLVEPGISNEDLMREILRSRAESDQIEASVRALSERVERLESTAKFVDGPGGED